MSSILIIGAGRAGLALGRAFADAGFEVCVASSSAEGRSRVLARGLASGSIDQRHTEWIVAVPDDAVAEVAAQLAGAVSEDARPTFAFHVSGATPVTALAPLREREIHIGAMHPLQTLTFTSPADVLRGAPAAIGGGPVAEERARVLATAVGMRPFVVSEEARAAYHAAGAIAANYTVALLDVAIALAERAGMPPELAREGLASLAASAAARVNADGTEAALTGPIRRGDVGAVRRHLAALDARDPAAAELYRALGAYTLDIGRRAGLSRDAAAELERLMRPHAP